MKLNFAIAGVAVLIVIAILFATGIHYLWTKDVVQITVVDKERTGGDDGEYLVYADGEVFQNTDCVWAGKFSSSDLYRDLEIEGTYTAVVYGWRIPFLSMYRNIVSVN